MRLGVRPDRGAGPRPAIASRTANRHHCHRSPARRKTRVRMRLVTLLLLLSGVVFDVAAEQGWGADQPPTPEQVRFFETSIRPRLADHCYRCHGAAKQKADLRLDSRQAILTGG